MSQSTTTEWAVLNDAHQALRTAVRGVAAEDWNRPTPCANWTVTQVLQHAAGDQIGFAAFLTGGPGPSEDPFAPSGTLTTSPLTVAEEAMTASAEAWASVDKDAEEVTVPVPPGKMPAWLGAGACALDAAVHAWDIAVATGQPSPLTPQLARELMPVATAIVEPLRAFGAYAPALDPEDGDDDLAALLRYLGRRPDWTA
ncbi:TIGR03086 family metal-binding protein [Streptosporangium sp. NPDC000396]|uniref:TIGR03086 family metal-binding protein n=1 Tax=Streptosporangium sp. NPDC000396 TaxID=3366185 RepID=UPI0036AC453A